MRKLLILMIAVCLGHALYAQSGADFTTKKNEVSLNLPIAIFASFPEISYERILAEDMGVGLSMAFALEEEYLELDFIATPYARWYFGGSMDSAKRYAAGFFIEANGAIFTSDSYKKKTGYGLGLAVGWKFVTNGNWTGQIFAGAGRNFNKGKEAYPRLGITIGKRF